MDKNIRDEYLKILEKERVVINFEKKNGEIRSLYCTRNEKYIPKTQKEIENIKLDRIKRKENISVIQVYDLLIEQWRSFTIDKVLSFKIVK